MFVTNITNYWKITQHFSSYFNKIFNYFHYYMKNYNIYLMDIVFPGFPRGVFGEK